MKRTVIIIAAGAAIAAGLAFARPFETPTSSPAAVEPPQTVLYGHISTMTRTGRGFELKFDPAWWLTGVAAERAKLEDTGSRDVPNDYYVVEEGHRLLTFVVPADARVTVLTNGTESTRISAGELAQIVEGRNPNQRDLSQPKGGFWVRIAAEYPSPAVTLDQQYQP
jgi:hypothetical protein